MKHLCLGCPPSGYPTDATRCAPCPRRGSPDTARYRIMDNDIPLAKRKADANQDGYTAFFNSEDCIAPSYGRRDLEAQWRLGWKKAAADSGVSVPARPCNHPWCGTQTACCRSDCPLVMIQGGNGRWQWVRRGGSTDVPWPDGTPLGGRSSANWDHEDLMNE